MKVQARHARAVAARMRSFWGTSKADVDAARPQHAERLS